MTTSTEIRLAAHPDAAPTLAHFAQVTTQVPDPQPGQLLVRNRYFSLDPGMLWRMREPGLPIPQFTLGAALFGEAVGEVVASAAPGFAVGALVHHPLGWREFALVDAATARQIDADAYPTLSTHLSFGLSAYVGLVAVAELRRGDTVFVSSAAGSSGALAGQFARALGAGRVIGSAGSPAKVAYLTEQLGFDAAFDYHDGPIADRLREAAPEGIDVYFDNVGGEQLRAAIEVMNPQGRVALHGALAEQRTGRPVPALDTLAAVIGKRITLRGFTVNDHWARIPEFGPLFRGWLANGSVSYSETVVDGIANAPQALLDLVAGQYTGKVVVRP